MTKKTVATLGQVPGKEESTGGKPVDNPALDLDSQCQEKVEKFRVPWAQASGLEVYLALVLLLSNYSSIFNTCETLCI